MGRDHNEQITVCLQILQEDERTEERRIWIAADKSELFRKVRSNENTGNLQDDLDILVTWLEKWKMIFYFDKCKHLHLDHKNKYWLL